VLLQLLASSSVSDVQESIAMLLTCKQFEVDGTGDTIRRMLPLVFAKEQGEWASTGGVKLRQLSRSRRVWGEAGCACLTDMWPC
jgi:hypothetical protein